MVVSRQGKAILRLRSLRLSESKPKLPSERYLEEPLWHTLLRNPA